jgi:hypothetical protein
MMCVCSVDNRRSTGSRGLKTLQPGDTLTVWRLGGLCRSLRAPNPNSEPRKLDFF